MPVPHASTGFGDLLDPRFQRIFHEQYEQLPDMLPMLYTMPPPNGRADMRWSQSGAFQDWGQFNSSVSYQSSAQGYDTIATPLEFASGFQVERKLVDDEQYNIIEQWPAGLATAAQRTRQVHGARPLNNAFSVDTFFYVNSEAVAMCSDSHTTTNPNTSTASGFDNLVTTALSATSLTAARIQMVGFLDDAGNRMMLSPDELWLPPNLFDVAYEIVASMGKVDTADNNRNVHEGAYTIHEWNYMTDTNNWIMGDSALRKQMMFWIDRVAPEFAFAEDLDTITGKWRGYGRWGNAHTDWRWSLGAQVS
ncbi:MAG: Mu-like prophage major head subunit gpT family protein [Planctomycetes bacterium]|nr:Mu-like prophage major head subunit gpT family protein [Planctomycetota bacterium]